VGLQVDLEVHRPTGFYAADALNSQLALERAVDFHRAFCCENGRAERLVLRRSVIVESTTAANSHAIAVEESCTTVVLAQNCGNIEKAAISSSRPDTSGGMVTILFALVSLLSFRFRSRASLELELVILRHQMIVLRRQRALTDFGSFQRASSET
jgi:hypothetical protein